MSIAALPDTCAGRGCSSLPQAMAQPWEALPYPQPVLGTSLFVPFDANSEMAGDAETRKRSTWHVR